MRNHSQAKSRSRQGKPINNYMETSYDIQNFMEQKKDLKIS